MNTVTHYLRLEPDGALPNVSALAPFKAIVVLNTHYSTDWQDSVSQWLVRSGCLYMMAWGPNCTTWDDSVDWSNMREYPDHKVPDDRFILTTWHDNESLEEVFWYAQFNANFSYNDVELVNALIVDVSNEDRQTEFLTLFKESESWADRQPADKDSV